MTHTTTDAAEARALTTHPCWTKTFGGRLSHRHWFHRDQLQPTCERCSTPIDREHNEVGPVAWEPPIKPSRATAEAASGAVVTATTATEDQLRRIQLLADVELHLKSCRIFLTSREKMHPCGIELHDELLANVTAAIEQEGRNG